MNCVALLGARKTDTPPSLPFPSAPRSLKPVKAMLACGKHFADADFIVASLARARIDHDIATIVHGGHQANGATIETWCREHDVHIVRYPANRLKHGRRAEDIRNSFMLQDSRPDLVIALPGGASTRSLINRAIAQGVPVLFHDSLIHIAP